MSKSWHIFVAGKPACENSEYIQSGLPCEIASEQVEVTLARIESVMPNLQRVSAVQGRCPKKVSLSTLFE